MSAPVSTRLHFFVIGALAAVVTLVLAVLQAGGTEAGRLDGWVPLAEGGWHTVALVIDFAGEPVGAAVLLVALAGACLAAGKRRLAVLAVLGPGVTVAVTMLLKPLVGRTIHGPDNLSFPSGHTASAAAFGFVLGLLLIDARRVVLVLGAAMLAGAAMAWSQVTLGAHYETDTIGGLCIALAVVPVTAWLLDRVADRRQG